MRRGSVGKVSGCRLLDRLGQQDPFQRQRVLERLARSVLEGDMVDPNLVGRTVERETEAGKDAIGDKFEIEVNTRCAVPSKLEAAASGKSNCICTERATDAGFDRLFQRQSGVHAECRYVKVRATLAKLERKAAAGPGKEQFAFPRNVERVLPVVAVHAFFFT